MKAPMIATILLGLALPASAQGINPAIEGDGAQVQGLELLDGAVSVSIETSGSVSLGRGDDNVSGGASVTINELSIGLGAHSGQPGSSASSPVAPASPPGASARVPDTVGSSNVGAGSGAPCALHAMSLGDLAHALDQGLPILSRQVSCRPLGGHSLELAAEPRLSEWLDRAGVDPARVISITINSDAVIVDHAGAH